MLFSTSASVAARYFLSFRLVRGEGSADADEPSADEARMMPANSQLGHTSVPNFTSQAGV